MLRQGRWRPWLPLVVCALSPVHDRIRVDANRAVPVPLRQRHRLRWPLAGRFPLLVHLIGGLQDHDRVLLTGSQIDDRSHGSTLYPSGAGEHETWEPVYWAAEPSPSPLGRPVERDRGTAAPSLSLSGCMGMGGMGSRVVPRSLDERGTGRGRRFSAASVLVGHVPAGNAPMRIPFTHLTLGLRLGGPDVSSTRGIPADLAPLPRASAVRPIR
jgi:hypothetical protein